MAASKELDAVLEIIRTWTSEVRKTVEHDRLSYEKMFASLPWDDDVETERVGANGVPSEWITAPGADPGRVVLYFHGGGFVFGSMRTHRVMLAHLSRAAKARVLGLDYRLAPENPFPAPIEDALAAYRWLLDQGIDPKKITLAGDSAGGGLVLSSLVAIRYAGLPMPAAGIPISAWTDMEATGESMTTNAEADTWVDRDGLLNIAKVYLNGKDPRAPLASPLHADLRGLPPLLMQVGGVEVLLDDTTALAERAKEAGVSVEVEVWDDMPHVWHTFAPILPEGEKAIDRIGEFILQHTG
jgi:acetyl esterase/lipase